VLVSTIELFTRARRAQVLGIKGASDLRLDWHAVIERKDRIVASWSKGKEAVPSKLGIPVLRGMGTFAGPHEIKVNGNTLSAEKIIIATGSKPGRPPIPGAELGITSDELIHLKEQPKQLVVIGGGFIGLEFGFALARAGTKVTLLQSGPQIGPGLDDEIRDVLLKAANELGMTILTNVKVKALTPDKRVEAEIAGRAERYPADTVLLATGRPANVKALNPQAAGIELDGSAVKINEYLQSVSAPHIYAVGDAAGKRQHSPVAWYEGPIAAHNALKGNERKADFTFSQTPFSPFQPLVRWALRKRKRWSGASKPERANSRTTPTRPPACAMKPKAWSRSYRRRRRIVFWESTSSARTLRT
jgi:pyruvate/2-oxoglutarate dehydrogenase complex dihydrolipoamide dehydrogenase (E3) component